MGWRGQPGSGKIDVRDWVVPDEAIIGQRPGILANGARVFARDLDYSGSYDGDSVSAITTSGTTMWLYTGGHFRAFNLGTKARDATKDILSLASGWAGHGIRDIHSDGTTLYAYALSTTLSKVGWRAWTISTLARDNTKEGSRGLVIDHFPTRFVTDGTTLWYGDFGSQKNGLFQAVTLPNTPNADKDFQVSGFRIPMRLVGGGVQISRMYGSTLVGDHIFFLIGSHIYPQEAPFNIVAFKKDTFLRAPEMDFLNLHRKGLVLVPQIPRGLTGNAETMWVNDTNQGKCLAFDVDPKRTGWF